MRDFIIMVKESLDENGKEIDKDTLEKIEDDLFNDEEISNLLYDRVLLLLDGYNIIEKER